MQKMIWLIVLPLVSLEARSADQQAPVVPPDQSHRERAITSEERDYWAYKPPRRPPIPAVSSPGWTRNPVDAFILAGLDGAGLKPADEADRATLLRRLSFDLTGLPPSPAEIDAFSADASDRAYEKQVDRLLATPAYGIRWAQHWLDLARYADSGGFEFDRDRPHLWRYRDWVIYALNKDMPYDQFIRFQVAGDEIAPDDPLAFIATGLNRCYPDTGDAAQPEASRQKVLDDITETIGSAFLGITIGCARCHDHKTDPIRQTDFYGLQAFFAAIKLEDGRVVSTPARRAEYQKQMSDWEHRVASLMDEIIRLEDPVRRRLDPYTPPMASRKALLAFKKPEAERDPRDVAATYRAFEEDVRLPEQTLMAALGEAKASKRAALINILEEVRNSRPIAPPIAIGIEESTSTAPPTYLRKRGEFSSKGPEVSPRFPAILCSNEEGPPNIVPSALSTGRRRALAEWLARPQNPLTARVVVNRIWQHHFGRGIVATPSDFGMTGESPTHPELLDWLATELVELKWSLKAMHKVIVTSAAYRQSSIAGITATSVARGIDPDNNLLWRQNRRRLEGEAIRDAYLATSGLLNPKRGGPAVFPSLPKGFDARGEWVASTEVERRRRSIYVAARRNLKFPLFESFDRPDPSVGCPRRAVTTTPIQALALLNGDEIHESARSLAERLGREAGPDADAQVALLFRLTLGRTAEPDEIAVVKQFLERSPLQDLCLSLMNSNEFINVD